MSPEQRKGGALWDAEECPFSGLSIAWNVRAVRQASVVTSASSVERSPKADETWGLRPPPALK